MRHLIAFFEGKELAHISFVKEIGEIAVPVLVKKRIKDSKHPFLLSPPPFPEKGFILC